MFKYFCAENEVERTIEKWQLTCIALNTLDFWMGYCWGDQIQRRDFVETSSHQQREMTVSCSYVQCVGARLGDKSK